MEQTDTCEGDTFDCDDSNPCSLDLCTFSNTPAFAHIITPYIQCVSDGRCFVPCVVPGIDKGYVL